MNKKTFKKLYPILDSMEIINENEITIKPDIKPKKSRCQYIKDWQQKNPEKYKRYREIENIRRREKKRLLNILL